MCGWARIEHEGVPYLVHDAPVAGPEHAQLLELRARLLAAVPPCRSRIRRGARSPARSLLLSQEDSGCECQNGYSGLDCSVAPSCYRTTPCVHGECLRHVCRCWMGWEGATCANATNASAYATHLQSHVPCPSPGCAFCASQSAAESGAFLGRAISPDDLPRVWPPQPSNSPPDPRS